MTTPLALRLAARIRQTGPITVADLMRAALSDPEHGYYMTRQPFGAQGDFITAPEISQMFGELVGLWLGTAWMAMGAPAAPVLAELGPGRGTLMADAGRALAKVPGFPRDPAVHLVETSPALREVQARLLGPSVRHWDDVSELPPGPLLLVANEFFDALPVRQFVRRDGGWHERLVGLDEDGGLAFGLDPRAQALPRPDAPDGAVAELCPAAADIAGRLGARLAADGGVALIVDYGYWEDSHGDTLQAVARHAKVPILATLGEADVTAHVDFAALSRAARAAGAAIHGPAEQGAFLADLGIGLRAARLSRLNPKQAETIARQHHRLTAREEMGSLFKVIALGHPGLGDLPALPRRP